MPPVRWTPEWETTSASNVYDTYEWWLGEWLTQRKQGDRAGPHPWNDITGGTKSGGGKDRHPVNVCILLHISGLAFGTSENAWMKQFLSVAWLCISMPIHMRADSDGSCHRQRLGYRQATTLANRTTWGHDAPSLATCCHWMLPYRTCLIIAAISQLLSLRRYITLAHQPSFYPWLSDPQMTESPTGYYFLWIRTQMITYQTTLRHRK